MPLAFLFTELAEIALGGSGPIDVSLSATDGGATFAVAASGLPAPGSGNPAFRIIEGLARQLRSEGRRFMRSMSQQLGMPLLHLRGDADPYVLADPVDQHRHLVTDQADVGGRQAGHRRHAEGAAQGAARDGDGAGLDERVDRDVRLRREAERLGCGVGAFRSASADASASTRA